MTFAPTSGKRSLLVIAHPGHELRLLGWLRKTRPLIAILTDGSGSTGQSRIDLSEQLIAEIGGEIVFAGRFTEAGLYALILEGKSAPLVELARELAQIIDMHDIGQVVCDAAEGHHPAHDLCLPLTRAAIRIRTDRSASPQHHEYRVIGDPRPGDGGSEEISLDLDDDALHDKIVRARRYASQSGARLAQEVEEMFGSFGEDAFRHEVLRPAGSESPQLHRELRYYEACGEQQVQAGRFRHVLRHAQHMLPIEKALNACC